VPPTNSEFICVHPPENLGAWRKGGTAGYCLARDDVSAPRTHEEQLQRPKSRVLRRVRPDGFAGVWRAGPRASDRIPLRIESCTGLEENPATYWSYPTNWKDIEWLGCSGKSPVSPP